MEEETKHFENEAKNQGQSQEITLITINDQSVKRKLSSVDTSDRYEKRQKTDPDIDADLNDPDVVEVLKSGSKIIYSCNTCRKEFNSLKQFNGHTVKHKDKVNFTKFYTCSLCKYICKRPASLLKHIEQHGKHRYGCEACDYTTNRPSVLKSHMLTHSAERPFACAECSFRGTQEGFLRYHYLKKHDITFE